jgi:hypothetical protein
MSSDVPPDASAPTPPPHAGDPTVVTPPPAAPAPTAQTGDRSATLVIALTLAAAVALQWLLQWGPVFTWTNGAISDVRGALWEWYIEDAAISFAYARNWANGDGLVAFVGGERIEGYSNPTWVALMAIGYTLGVDGFVSSKWMALGFSAATLVLTWRIAVEAIRKPGHHPAILAAPLFLAVFPQYAIWNASGLENSIFSFFLAGGVWRTLVEARTGGLPWASLWFLGLATSRPEGILYGAWAGFLAMTASLVAGRGVRRTAQWLGLFFVPFLGYHAIRYNYFAWIFPNTYYAKLADKDAKPLVWDSAGWKYIRKWAAGDFTATGKEGTGIGWFLPVFLSGLFGLRGKNTLAVVGASLLAAVFFLLPTSDPVAALPFWPRDVKAPEWWQTTRILGIFALCVTLPLTTVRREGWLARLLLWGLALVPFAFTLQSGGDWMRGYRWMSFLSVPIAVLFAMGLDAIAEAADRAAASWRPRAPTAPGAWGQAAWSVGPLVLLALLPSFYFQLEWFFGKRETGPASVRKRADYTASIISKLFLDDRQIKNLDVDMGAHMYWSPHLMLDMAGLVDVPMAHHDYSQRTMTKQYVFDEHKPEIAHVHGGWANSSKIPTFAEWKARYFEIPPFEASATTYHMGTHIRRDLVMAPSWEGGETRSVDYEDGLRLVGWRIPSPEVTAGRAFYLEIGVRYDNATARQDFRMLGFLSDANGHLQVFDLPPAYDWLPPSEWKPEEVFVGKFPVQLTGALPEGVYDIGFVFLKPDGTAYQPAPAAASEDRVLTGTAGVAPRLLSGEVRFPAALTLGGDGTSERESGRDVERARALAAEAKCPEALAAWMEARLHQPKNTAWTTTTRTELAPAFAACWLNRGEEAADDEAAARHIEAARFWQPRAPEVWKAADEVGPLLMSRADAARDASDWATAYRLYTAALAAKPTLSWARRYAEDARDHVLGLDAESVARKAEADAARAASKEDAPARTPGVKPAPASPPAPGATDP